VQPDADLGRAPEHRQGIPVGHADHLRVEGGHREGLSRDGEPEKKDEDQEPEGSPPDRHRGLGLRTPAPPHAPTGLDAGPVGHRRAYGVTLMSA
jgi:hypothetical protein